MSLTLEQVRQLRRSLPPMDFQSPASNDALTKAYLSHYGLDRLVLPWPTVQSLGSFPSLKYRLAAHYFAVPAAVHKGVFVIVHGYYDHVGLFSRPIEFCLSLGYSVLAFDLPGHGLSEGDAASIVSFDHYSQALVDCLRLAEGSGVVGPWHVLAQSTGAAAVINCLLKSNQFPVGKVQKVILLAPLLRPADWTRGLLKYWLLHWFVERVPREFARNSHDRRFLRFIAEDDPLQARYLMVDWVSSLRVYLNDFSRAPQSGIPLSIIQGTGDTTVDWRYNLTSLQAKFPLAETFLIEGARHHLVNESGEYQERLFAIINGIVNS